MSRDECFIEQHSLNDYYYFDKFSAMSFHCCDERANVTIFINLFCFAVTVNVSCLCMDVHDLLLKQIHQTPWGDVATTICTPLEEQDNVRETQPFQTSKSLLH